MRYFDYKGKGWAFSSKKGSLQSPRYCIHHFGWGPNVKNWTVKYMYMGLDKFWKEIITYRINVILWIHVIEWWN